MSSSSWRSLFLKNRAMNARTSCFASSTVAIAPTLSGGVLIETASVLPPMQSGVDHFLQHRTWPVLAVAITLVEHFDRVKDGIQPDQVGRFEGAHLVAEPGAEDGVDLFRRCDAVL